MWSTRPAGGASPPQLPLQGLLSRTPLIVGACLAVAVLLAWAWLVTAGMPAGEMAGHAMPAMQPDPWSAAYLLPAFTMWALMMMAMMLPSAAPMILLHARIDRAGSEAARLRHTLLAAAAYLLVWAVFSGAAAVGQAALIGAGLVASASLSFGDGALAAAVLVLAGVYQLSSGKAACLDQCRSPLAFVMRYWRPGPAGAVRLGVAHGLYCLGCCWALMLLLFVGGVMNLAWVAVLAALVMVEKLAPPHWHASRVIAGALFAGALLLLF